MPELPEVQTIVNDLNKKIVDLTINDFWSDCPKNIKNTTIAAFSKAIKGRKILRAHRFGKNIFIDLSGGKSMYIHLKMTGHLLVKKKNPKAKSQKNYFSDRVNQYIHHIWFLNKGINLEFSDLRKFAKIVLLDTDKIKEYKDIKSLGVDAMSPEFSYKKFLEILAKRKNNKIGAVLMEQNLIAGIGNIYRSEILFAAGISPFRKVDDLKDEETKIIYKNIKSVLKKAIQLRGTSDSDYRDTDGAPGGFQKVMKVYNQEKKACRKKNCRGTIKRQKMNQRSVFWCEKCQH